MDVFMSLRDFYKLKEFLCLAQWFKSINRIDHQMAPELQIKGLLLNF